MITRLRLDMKRGVRDGDGARYRSRAAMMTRGPRDRAKGDARGRRLLTTKLGERSTAGGMGRWGKMRARAGRETVRAAKIGAGAEVEIGPVVGT